MYIVGSMLNTVQAWPNPGTRVPVPLASRVGGGCPLGAPRSSQLPGKAPVAGGLPLSSSLALGGGSNSDRYDLGAPGLNLPLY